MPVTVADCFGRTRSAELFPDGESWTCPFCGAGVIPSRQSELPCANPWCVAHPKMATILGKAGLVDRAHDEALRIAEDQRRAAVSRFAMERIREDRAAADAAWHANREKARAAGQCVKCASDPYRPKFTKHRAGHAHLLADAREGVE